MAENGYSDGSVIVDTTLDSKGFEAGSAKLRRAVDSLVASFNLLNPTFQRGINGDVAALKQFQKAAEKMEVKIQRAKEEQEEFAATRFTNPEFEKLEKDISKAETALFRLYNKRDKLQLLNTDQGSQTWKNVIYDIKAAEEQLERLEAQRDAMRSSGKMDFLGVDTAEYKERAAELADLLSLLSRYREEAAAAERAKAAERTASEEARASEKAAAAEARASEKAAAAEAKEAERAANEEARAADQAAFKFKELQHTIEYGLLRVLKTMGKAGLSGFRAIGSSITSAISRIKSFTTHTKIGDKSIKSLVKSFTGFFAKLKSRVYRKLITSVYSGAVTGIKNLVQEFPQLNESISSIVSSLDYLKNSFATAFAPIINIAAPALSKLIDLLADAFTHIGMIVSALNGATTVKQAVKVQKDYAASLKETEKAANAAKKSLAGFDELNNTTTSADSASSGANTLFTDAPIDSSILSFIRRIKEAFLTGEYDAIGKAVAGKINGIFKRINSAIVNAQPKIKSGIKAFTGAFNSIVDNIDWALIGDTFGLGFNTIVDSVYGIITGINWGNLGAKLSTGLNGFIRRVDWKLLGKTIGSAFSSALDFLYNAAKEFDWAGLGNAIGNAIEGLRSSFSFVKVGKAAATTLNGIFKSLRNIIRKTDWKAWANDLTDGINTFISDTNWGELGAMIGESFTGVLDFMYTAILNFDVKKAAKAIYDLFNNFIANVDWNELGKTISGGITKALNFIAELLEGIDWEGAGEGIADFLNGIDFTGILKGILRVLKGILKAIPSLIKGLVTNIDFDTVVGIVGTAFGLKFLSKLLSYFTTGANGLFSSIGSTLSGKFSGAVSGLGSTIGGKMVAGIGAALAGWQIGTWIREKWGPQIDEALEPMWETIFGKPEVLSDDENERKARRAINRSLYGIDSDQKLSKADIDRAYGAGYEAMKAMADAFGVEVPKAFTDAYENYVKSKKDAIEKSAHDSVSWFSSGLRDSKRYADSAIYVVAEGVKNELGSIKNSALTSGIETVSWFSNGISNNKWRSDYASSAVADGVKSSLNTSGENAYNDGQNSVLNIAAGLNDNKWHSDSAANSIASSIRSTFSTVSNDAWTWGSDICSAISRGMDNNISFVTQSAWAAAAEIDSILGFSEPEKGPLSNFHTYMPDMLQLMAKGIKDNEHVAVNAVSELAGKISDEAGEIEILAPIDGKSGYTHFLNNFADKIADKFTELMNRLQSIADNVTFRVPAVAAGTVVPYGAYGPTSGGSSAALPDLSEITRRMDEMSEKLDNIEETIDGKETGITEDAVYSTVKKKARKETKTTGRNPFGANN